jgi:hypothetical protein
MVILLLSPPLPIVGSGILELDPFESLLIIAVRMTARAVAVRVFRLVLEGKLRADDLSWLMEVEAIVVLVALPWRRRGEQFLQLRAFVTFRRVLDELDRLATRAVNGSGERDGHGLDLLLFTVAVKIEPSVGYPRAKAVRDCHGKVVSPVAGPDPIVREKETLVDLRLDIGDNGRPFACDLVVRLLRVEWRGLRVLLAALVSGNAT